MAPSRNSGCWMSIAMTAKGELELLFVLPECHSKGIGQAVPEEEEGNWSMDDEMFVFRKEIKNDES
ncbi:MAG: hypothetical protein IKX29_08540 [Bacteroidales bacterium]|nr:hypothetical protein [Bacteroidales bacterium]